MKDNITRKVCLMASLALLSACSGDDGLSEELTPPVPVVRGTEIRVTVGDESAAGTRVWYEEDGRINAYWNEDKSDALMVVYDGIVSEIPMTELNDNKATFSGTLSYNEGNEPEATTPLKCIVKNEHISINASDGTYSYQSGAVTSQDGSLAAATALNVLSATCPYGDGTNIRCGFQYNSCVLKLIVTPPTGTVADTPFTLTYYCTGGDAGIITVNGTTTATTTPLYFGIPAGSYTDQHLVLSIGGKDITYYLSANNRATFKDSRFYQKSVSFANPELTADGVLVAGWDAGTDPWGDGTVITGILGGWSAGSNPWGNGESVIGDGTLGGWGDLHENPWGDNTNSSSSTAGGWNAGTDPWGDNSHTGNTSAGGWSNGGNPWGTGESVDSNSTANGWSSGGDIWGDNSQTGNSTTGGWNSGTDPWGDHPETGGSTANGWTSGSDPWGDGVSAKSGIGGNSVGGWTTAKVARSAGTTGWVAAPASPAPQSTWTITTATPWSARDLLRAPWQKKVKK